MRLEAAPTLESYRNVNFFDLAVLLAEGQSGNLDENWDLFVDNLSRITDDFARAREAGVPKIVAPLPEFVSIL